MTSAPRPDDDPDAAIVIDDAHLLADEELDRARRAGVRSGRDGRRRRRTAHPTPGAAGAGHRAGARESGDIARLADAPRGRRGGRPGDRRPPANGNRSGPDGLDRRPAVPVASGDGRCGITATASLRRTPSSQAAKFALIERLRRVEEPVLDTLLVSSLSPELGARRRRCGASARLPTRRDGWSTARAPADSSSPRTARRFCDRSTSASPRSSAPHAITTSRSHCCARRSN